MAFWLTLYALTIPLVCLPTGNMAWALEEVAASEQTPGEGPQPRRAKFFRKEYEPYERPGTSVIMGQAYLTMEDGERTYCSRQAVFMNPVTTYSFEWYQRNVIDRIELEPADARADDYHWVTRADSQGRFRFERLPAGSYYIGCRVLPEEGFAHAEVTVGKGETVEVVVTRETVGRRPGRAQAQSSGPSGTVRETDPPFGRLHPEAPPETAQWGRLAGTWACSLPSVRADGTVHEGKATWRWSYTIGGYAVRDEYIGHAGEGAAFHGSGLRIYNPAVREWEIAWIDNGRTPADRPRKIKSYRATYENEEIVMRQVNGDPSWRTIFYDITDDTFEWRNEPSRQRMHCTRTCCFPSSSLDGQSTDPADVTGEVSARFP